MEDFVNGMNDWRWGPFEFLHPPKDVNIGWSRFIITCLLGVPLTMAGILVAGTLVIFYLAHPYFHRLLTLPQYGMETQFFLKEMWWALVAGGVWFPLAWWPSVLCWNRRAARLRQPKPTAPTPQKGVWPPAPKRV